MTLREFSFCPNSETDLRKVGGRGGKGQNSQKNGHFWPKIGQNRPKMAHNGFSWAKKWLKSLKLGSGRGKNGFSALKNGRTPLLGPVPPCSGPNPTLGLGPPPLLRGAIDPKNASKWVPEGPKRSKMLKLQSQRRKNGFGTP